MLSACIKRVASERRTYGEGDMEEELELFEPNEYKLREIKGRKTLQLHGNAFKRKKIGVGAMPKILNAIANGWDVDINCAVIDDDIYIENARLERDADGKAIIAGRVTISASIVNGIASFSGAKFEQEAKFGANFKMGADFGKVTFEHIADFTGAIFEAGASFEGANFRRTARFDGASFRDADPWKINYRADFREASFEKVDFTVASFETIADFTKAEFEEAKFIRARFEEEVAFTGASFKKVAHFGGVDFEKPGHFGEVEIDENTVPKGFWNDGLHPFLYRIAWLLTMGKFKLKLPKLPVTDVSHINTNTVMNSSSNPRLKRHIDDEQWLESWRRNPKGKRWRGFMFWLWELTSHCGRSIGLWAAWSVLLAYVFARIYGAFGYDSIAFNVDKLAGKQPDFWAYLYHSIVTFTTLGFGDIVPLTNRTRLAVGAEVVLGYVMLGGLISIFANKFARRS